MVKAPEIQFQGLCRVLVTEEEVLEFGVWVSGVKACRKVSTVWRQYCLTHKNFTNRFQPTHLIPLHTHFLMLWRGDPDTWQTHHLVSWHTQPLLISHPKDRPQVGLSEMNFLGQERTVLTTSTMEKLRQTCAIHLVSESSNKKSFHQRTTD